VSGTESVELFTYGDANRERAETVLRQAFIAAQLGMPSEDPETAVESIWIILEALLVEHLAPSEPIDQMRSERLTDIGTHWRRMVITAVTNTFVLSGGFVQPEPMAAAVAGRADLLVGGSLWHTRRPPAQGALVLRVHSSLQVLDATARSGQHPGAADATALEDLIACATLGAVMAGETLPSPDIEDRDTTDDTKGRWAKSTESVAAAFGIGGVELVEIAKTGWACTECGCVFLGSVDAGIAYPDRFAPVGRSGACDQQTDCSCHAAPLQRRVR
jgi:hypothetical protein